MKPNSHSDPVVPPLPGSPGNIDSPRLFQQATLVVNADQALAVLPSRAFRSSGVMYDPALTDATSLSVAAAAGIGGFNFPVDTGGVYHWQTHSYYAGFTDPYGRTSPPAGNTYTAFRTAAKAALPSADFMLSANLDNDLAGTGPGTTAEAAAWVTDALVTNAFPLSEFALWRIGGEEYNNGFYGPPWTPGIPQTKYAPTDPTTVGGLMRSMAQAMKAVNNGIKCGAVLYPDNL